MGAKMMGADTDQCDLNGAQYEIEEFARRGWLRGAIIGQVYLDELV